MLDLRLKDSWAANILQTIHRSVEAHNSRKTFIRYSWCLTLRIASFLCKTRADQALLQESCSKPLHYVD